MDFHSLARRDLQLLCKKNRVPANLTNVAMAQALEALETVEGIEEIQEALGFQYSKVKSPELLPQVIPLSQSHGVTVKTLEVTEMASKEEEIHETTGLQPLNVNSPEPPLTSRRTSARRVAIREELKIQQQKPSPLHRSRCTAAKDLEVTEMASKEEQGEEREAPTLLPRTPATRKTTKGVEAQSSRRRAKKNAEVEDHVETPMPAEAKGGKAIRAVTRRSTRLSSRKALEETATTQPKRRSRGNAAVKMEALAKEDIEEQEKEEETKELVEYGDSCVSIGEHAKKYQETESHEFSSSIDGEGSKDEVENEPMIQQQQPRLHARSCRVTTKASEVIKIASKDEEDDKKAQKLLPTPRRSTRMSSRKPTEEKIREEGTVKMAALTEEDAEEQENKEEKKDLSEKRVSCVVTPADEDKEKDKKGESHGYSSSVEVEDSDSIVALVEEVEKNDQEVEIQEESSNMELENDYSMLVEGDEVKDQKVESPGFSSSIEVENGDFIVALVEEIQENDQEVEIHRFSSSNQREDSNIEVENDDSSIVLAEGDEMKDEKVEIHDFSTIEMTSKVEVENEDSTVELVEGDQKNNQELEIQVLISSIEGENSIVELKNDFSNIALAEGESGDQPSGNEYVKDSNDHPPEKEFVEIFRDQSLPDDDLAEDSSNQRSEFVEGDLLPANEDVEDTVDHSSDAKFAISAVSDNLRGKMRPLSHQKAIGSSEIDEEERKLSLLFAEMTLKEVEECCDALLIPVVAQNSAFVSEKFSTAMVISQDDYSSRDLPPAMVIPAEPIDELQKSENSQGAFSESHIPVSYSELCSEFSTACYTIEVKEVSVGHLNEILEKSAENDHHELAEDDESFDEPAFSESHIPVSYSELCSEFSTACSTIEVKEVSVGHLNEILEKSAENYHHELAEDDESFDETHKTEIYSHGFCEFSTVDSAIEFKETFGDESSEISLVIDESVEARLPNSDSKKPVDVETSQEASSEPQIALEEVSLKEGALELLSLTKLKAMYKQMSTFSYESNAS